MVLHIFIVRNCHLALAESFTFGQHCKHSQNVLLKMMCEFGLFSSPVSKKYKLCEWDRQLSSVETIQYYSTYLVKQIKSKIKL